MKRAWFQNVYVVPRTGEPDGNFPTVESKSEGSKAFELALKLAKVDADVVLTDPDSDRLGVFSKISNGRICFIGSMSALLICEYELSRKETRILLIMNCWYSWLLLFLQVN